MEIWHHPCPAYIALQKKIKPKAEAILNSEIILPGDSINNVPADTVKRIIRW